MKKHAKIALATTTLIFIFNYSTFGNLKHTVKADETLWNISEYYEVDIEDIVRFNSHINNPNLIYNGNEIILPTGYIPVFSSNSVTSYENKLLKLINDERVKNNLNPLISDEQLKTLATVKNEDMSKNDYFDHISNTYDTVFSMLNVFNIDYNYAGENIAKGQDTPEQVFVDWLNSDDKNNILNENFTNIGISYLNDNNNYWTLVFTGK